MGWFDNWFGKTGIEVYEQSYETKNIGDIIIPEKLTNNNAYVLANSVPEIFFPIDFYADRISKLRFFIATSSGIERPNTELTRFITNINPLWSFTDLVYNYAFSLLGDGNGISKITVPSTYKDATPSTIERWDVLQPNLTTFREHNNISILDIYSINELIKQVFYNDGSIYRRELDVNSIRIDNYGLKRQSGSVVKSEGVLWKANKSIDTLLSVYSARYNVYANNGMAGILSKKESRSTSSMEAVMMNVNKRDEIIEDIKQRHGLTGKKNIFGISGTPVEFVKTIASIAELMPFEETLDCSIKIASILQIPSGLVPRKDQSTFDNQASNEQSVWENGLLSFAQTICNNLTRLFGLNKIGYKIGFDASNVSALVQNETENEDLIAKKLANIEKIKQLNPGIDINPLVNEILLSYGQE